MQSSQQHANTLAVQSAADYLMLLHSLKPGKVKDNWRQLKVQQILQNLTRRKIRIFSPFFLPPKFSLFNTTIVEGEPAGRMAMVGNGDPVQSTEHPAEK